jgi:hypothetical protein
MYLSHAMPTYPFGAARPFYFQERCAALHAAARRRRYVLIILLLGAIFNMALALGHGEIMKS